MTHRCILPDWAGKTVAVLASGKSLTQAAADAVRHLPRIAVRRAFRLAPDADIVLALDGPPNHGFWDESVGISGMRICGAPVEGLDAAWLNIPHEVVTLRPGHVIHVRNNGLAAIRVAAMTGANRILLVGFDPEPFGHFYGSADSDWDKYPGLTQGLVALVKELGERGVVVEGAPSTPASSPVEYTAPHEVDALVELLRSNKVKTVVEIGVNRGLTAKALLAGVPTIKQYVGVDAAVGHVPALQGQVGEIPVNPGDVVAGDPRVQIIAPSRGSFDLTAADLPIVDGMFIDGDHSRAGVLNDYALAEASVRAGGLIVFHDDNDRTDMDVTATLAEIGGFTRIFGTTLAYKKNGHRKS
jgi:predicted O-methyltransferase YrrM